MALFLDWNDTFFGLTGHFCWLRCQYWWQLGHFWSLRALFFASSGAAGDVFKQLQSLVFWYIALTRRCTGNEYCQSYYFPSINYLWTFAIIFGDYDYFVSQSSIPVHIYTEVRDGQFAHDCWDVLLLSCFSYHCISRFGFVKRGVK